MRIYKDQKTTLLKSTPAILVPFLLAFGIMGVVMAARGQSKSPLPKVEHIGPNADKGFSMATKVKDVALAFSDQIFPFD